MCLKIRRKRHAHQKTLTGFTMIEILAVVAIIGILVGLLLPAIQSSREGARRTSCASNLSQIGLAIIGYHNAFEQFPVQLSGTDGSQVADQDNDRRLSVFVALLPFMDNANLANEIADAHPKFLYDPSASHLNSQRSIQYTKEFPSENWPASGPEPFQSQYRWWHIEPLGLRCPSDPGMGHPSMGRCNYAVCLGDGIVGSSTGAMKEVMGTFVVDPLLARETDISMRGIFVPRSVTRFSDVTDGLSQTLLLGEICTGLGDEDIRTQPVAASRITTTKLLRNEPQLASNLDWIDVDRPQFWKSGAPFLTTVGLSEPKRGFRWADGMPLFTAFNTVLPPNHQITLALDQEDSDGILPPSSRHQVGVQVCMADGAVSFVSDSIDAGNSNRPTVHSGSYPEINDKNSPVIQSPFGVWGAMGTRASSEWVAGDFEVIE
jgi:prepilin-type N-terminal cleavage/methylation domain-containing protein